VLRYSRTMRLNRWSFTAPIRELELGATGRTRPVLVLGVTDCQSVLCAPHNRPVDSTSRASFCMAWKSSRCVNSEHWSSTTSGTQSGLFDASVVVRRGHFDGVEQPHSCRATGTAQSFYLIQLETAQHQNAQARVPCDFPRWRVWLV